MSKKIKLIALDMDGTLFDNHSQITPENQKAIKAATDAGVHVAISTGRAYVGLPVELLCELGVHYAITSNAAAIYRLPQKECLYTSCMKAETVCPIIRKLQTKDVHFDAFIDGNCYGQHSLQPLIDRLQMPDSIKHYIKTSRSLTDDLADFISSQELEVQKMIVNFYSDKNGIFVDRDAVAAILSEYPQITYLSGGYHNLEFTKAGTTKAKGLQFLADLFGITMEETMACGDTQNDMDMISAAGIGVAMANAKDDVKKMADYVTLSNEESGVAHAIKKFVLEA